MQCLAMHMEKQIKITTGMKGKVIYGYIPETNDYQVNLARESDFDSYLVTYYCDSLLDWVY